MNLSVVRAIFVRNFVSYFSNPTGYVFICVFVLLSGFAAYWPHEFFNANLANLNQLNKYLPYIMLVFIPAITMSVWSDERRQGTDELLLTIPASDFDVVIGKYLAAVAIFSAALAFSLSNIVVLLVLGTPDLGLLLANYFGYWLVGLAMLSIGMAASFLTRNLTVGFILGALFNAPLVFASSAGSLLPWKSIAAGARWLLPDFIGNGIEALPEVLKRWSVAESFQDFGRGVISLASVTFFLVIVVVMLYLSMVFIARRHWAGGRRGRAMATHYFVRIVALGLALLGVNLLIARGDVRLDITQGRLASLSPKTRELIGKLEPKRPVLIEAYISPEVPESYVQTRLDLITKLRELNALGGSHVEVRMFDTERYSEEAARAESQYGIHAQPVDVTTRGAMKREEIYLGVAVMSGLEKVVVPFFDHGIPVEYELIRSIVTVSDQKRKKIGVLTTDAKLFGGFNMQSMTPSRNELIIDELQKQYEVVQVNADSPIAEDLDVLLAVQPSSLSPQQMQNFVAAVHRGTPTAIFEDPFPYLDPNVPGTLQPKRPQQQGMMGMRSPPQEKGNIHQLWNLLGVDFPGSKVVWQDYNPYPKISQFPREFVFVGTGEGAEEPFNDRSVISSGLQEMLFLFPGAVRRRNASDLTFTPLIRTGRETGTVGYDEILQQSFLGGGGLNPVRRQIPTREVYDLAVHIHGKLSKSGDLSMADEGSPLLAQADKAAPGGSQAAEKPLDAAEAMSDPFKQRSAAGKSQQDAAEIDVVLVADIDVLYSAFFALRARGNDPNAMVNLDLDNVTFVLNTLDELAGDDRFIDIRKRRPVHRTLSQIDAWTKDARERADDLREQYRTEFQKGVDEEQKKLDSRVAEIEKQTEMDPMQKMIEVQTARRVGEKRLDTRRKQLEQSRDREIETVDRGLEIKVGAVQDRVKRVAVLLPIIPPLLLGLLVFFQRRSREREGVSRERLR